MKRIDNRTWNLKMGILNGARIEFEDSMCGYVGEGQTDPLEGLKVGRSG